MLCFRQVVTVEDLREKIRLSIVASSVVLSLFISGLTVPVPVAAEGKTDKKVSMAPRDAKEPGVAEGDFLTTNQGVRMGDDDNSLKAGARGPTLMEDFHFREKITHFDHERIPERVVHARGSGAHGYFQVYESMARYTKAQVLQDPSVKTPVFVRFSTVNGSRGSGDTVRDARGFATKFYTKEGVWDLVGNNIPVFFIQDAIKFPDLVHAFKPEADNEIPQASTAHDTFWDFISLTPESMHMIMWIMSDRAIPRSFRMMEGFGVNTFRFVNEQGKSTFVKFHWKPLLGVHSLVWDEAQKISGKDPDFHRRDLWDAIEMGAYPEYELGVQLLPEDAQDKVGFDILDATKIWPEDVVPVQRIGKLTLNRNPDSFFAETEQVAVHPGHIVPGIDFSDDPLLQGRLFSYLDTQINRFGGPNFHQLPINQPKSPVNNRQQDSFMRSTNRPGKANYEPNSLDDLKEATSKQGGFESYPAPVSGAKLRERSKTFSDHYSQATLFFKSLTPPEQDHLIAALQFELGKVSNKKVQERMLEHLANVDGDMTKQVATYIGLKAPKGQVNMKVVKTKGLSQEESPGDTIKTRKIAILTADGVNSADVSRMLSGMKKNGATAEVIAPHLGELAGGEVKVDKTYATAASVLYDAVYVPGGKESVKQLVEDYEVRHFVREAYNHGKAIAANGEGAELLQAAGIAPGPGVVSGKSSSDFTQNFVDAIKHRHWNRVKSVDKVKSN